MLKRGKNKGDKEITNIENDISLTNNRNKQRQSYCNIISNFFIYLYNTTKEFVEDEQYKKAIKILALMFFMGGVMTVILLTELYFMNMVSCPRDSEREMFIYEMKHPDLWEAQVFMNHYSCHIAKDCFIKTKIDNFTVSYDNSLRAKFIQFEIFNSIYSHLIHSFESYFKFLHYPNILDNNKYLALLDNNDEENIPQQFEFSTMIEYHSDEWDEKYLKNDENFLAEREMIRIFVNINHEINNFFATNFTMNDIRAVSDSSLDSSLSLENNVNNENEIELIDEENEEEYSEDDEEEDHVYTLLGEYLLQHYNNENIMKLVDKEYNVSSKLSLKSNKLLGKSDQLLPILQLIDRFFIQFEKTNFHYLTINTNLQTHLKSLSVLSSIQKAREINQFYYQSAFQVTNSTAELRRIVDVGRNFISYIQENIYLLKLKFQSRSMFQFGHLIVALVFLVIYWWFKTEEMFYGNQQTSLTEDDYGFLRWKRKSITPICAMAINFCIAYSIIRILRTFSFSGTIIPNPNLHCKLRKYAESPTQSASFWEKTYYFLFVETNISHAGCNDLVFSGHVSIYTIICFIFHRYCPSYIISGVIYMIAAEPTIDAIFKGQHFTVDVVVAIYVTYLVERYVYDKIFPKVVGAEAITSIQSFELYVKNMPRRSLLDQIKYELSVAKECTFVTISFLRQGVVKLYNQRRKPK